MTGLYDVELIGTSDIDTNAIIAYAAIQEGLTVDLIENYSEYPSREEMATWLEEHNIGYDPMKNKPYDWHKKINGKKKDIEKAWLACQLGKNLGDISRIEHLPTCDLLTYSFPCFIEGTLVLTSEGYVPIEEIKEGDLVLTHTNSWQKVTQTMINEADSLMEISTMPSEKIYCTPNHPFYVRRKYKKWNEERRSYDRLFESAEWVYAKNLSKEYYVGCPINQIEEIPVWNGFDKKTGWGYKVHENRLGDYLNHKDFWYIIGRYIGDGWYRHDSGIIICANDCKIGQILSRLENLGFNYNIVKERTVNKVHIAFQDIGVFCQQFGRGAANKHLGKTILNLPRELLRSFLDGYIDSDGYVGANNLIKISSVSRTLVYETAQCIAKAYHRPFSIYFTRRPNTTVIEGRTVNQKDAYAVTFKFSDNIQDKAFYEGSYLWFPINDVKQMDYEGLVYNFSVENDESYVVQNMIVHNCTDISIAGKIKGFKEGSGTRSSLIHEVMRLLVDYKEHNELPKFLLMENVKNLVSKKFIDDFNDIVSLLDDIGYNTYWKVLNSKECGVCQNRERVFALSIRKDIDNNQFEFPKPFDTGIRLKDILLKGVDSKYYITNDRAKALIKDLVINGKITPDDACTPCDLTINKPDTIEYANCLTAREDRGIANVRRLGTGIAVVENTVSDEL